MTLFFFLFIEYGNKKKKRCSFATMNLENILEISFLYLHARRIEIESISRSIVKHS